jgi:hypothetical protein
MEHANVDVNKNPFKLKELGTLEKENFMLA